MKKFVIRDVSSIPPECNLGEMVELDSLSKKFSLHIVSLKENSIELHEHYNSTEVLYILDGYGALYMKECMVEKSGNCIKNSVLSFLKQGMLAVISPHIFHSIEPVAKDGKKALKFLIFETPTYCEGDSREICNSCK